MTGMTIGHKIDVAKHSKCSALLVQPEVSLTVSDIPIHNGDFKTVTAYRNVATKTLHLIQLIDESSEMQNDLVERNVAKLSFINFIKFTFWTISTDRRIDRLLTLSIVCRRYRRDNG